MATLVLSAVGSAIGGSVGGSVLGMSGAVIGRAVGATVGRAIDQRLLGQGSDPVEMGRIDRYRVPGVGEGAPVAALHGRMRLGGQVIWSTHFRESSTTTAGGKGGGGGQETTAYSYTVSLALALCEGEILSLGRIWADGTLIERSSLNLHLYRGTEDQLPDPKIEAVEGAGLVPAYRGMAYVVIEDLDLSPFGNRVPQFNFEVTRAAEPSPKVLPSAGDGVRGVALIPGAGEYSLATTPVSFQRDLGRTDWINLNSPSGSADFPTSMDALSDELPNCDAVSLVVSWFGNDLRASQCEIRPMVEQKIEDAAEMPWTVNGLTRETAEELFDQDGRPVFGGTPSDQSVLQALIELNTRGLKVMYYPFILMDVPAENGLPDPWSDASDQPALPWRGRITGDKALGVSGSTDRKVANAAAVDAFFGAAQASDFQISNGEVTYSGPSEWRYARFILHQAALCAAAGGVDAFCIGSELRGLTQMRDEVGFPFVSKLRDLAAAVRVLLPEAKIGYAADWSEYFGFHPQDGSGDVLFHLDPLWADANIDFVGIDNYMPLTDWRDGSEHLDASWGSAYNVDYLKSNIEGGEGFDWYYASSEGRAAQNRLPISDGDGTPWVFRYKDIRSWWSEPHIERRHAIERSVLTSGADPSAWVPVSGASISSHGSEFDRYAHPVEITVNAGISDGLSCPVPVALTSDQTYELRFHLRLGSAAGASVHLDHPAGALVVRVDDTMAITESGAVDDLLEAEVVPREDTVLTLRLVVRYGVEGALSLLVSPNSGTIGETLVFYGVDVTPWPVPPTEWLPRSKPIWFTEIGCPAIDKGTNQPNVFFDPKSSESAVPYFSNGRRDDVIAMQYLRATTQYWSDPQNNPVSEFYNGTMIDPSRIFVWAWDVRPYPAFPNDVERWSDGENFARGHWLSGRISGQSLDLVVAEICRRAGVDDVDVSQLYGAVRGYSSAEVETARGRLQPLMLAYDFTAVERGGQIVFQHLPVLPDAQVGPEDILYEGQGEGFEFTRAPEAETVGRVRITHVEADGAFDAKIAEAMLPDDPSLTVSQTDLPLSLTRAEARDLAERWLATSRLARDTVSFALPPSRRDVVAGSMLAFEDGTLWRVDQVEDRGARAVEATRAEPSLSAPPDTVEFDPTTEIYQPAVPVFPLFMDLPLVTGDEVPHAPHIAITASPWLGNVAVYSSVSEANFSLNTTVEAASTIGILETPLPSAVPGRWDRGPALRVRIPSGNLSSVTPEEVLNGANVAAIGAGDEGPWEVLQFAEAQLVAPEIWEISLRLRGQAGTDGIQPQAWPVGSYFVLLDGRQMQVMLASSARGLPRNYRVGPARQGLDAASYVARNLAFDGVGLRPYAPAHLRVRSDGNDLAFSWVRRGRLDSDSWQGADIPLGEDSEAYAIRVSDSNGLRREATVIDPVWTYSSADRVADGTGAAFTVDVAQISTRFGPGSYTRIEVHA